MQTRNARLIALVPLALAALAIAAPLLADSPLLSLSIRRFFSLVCHQDPARSFWIADAPIAVCVRCLGIYLGAVAGAIASMRRVIVLRLLLITLALNALDVAAEWFGLHGNLPALRLVFGLALGVAIGALVAAAVRESSSLRLRRNAPQPL